MDHLSESERRRVAGLYEGRIAEHGLTVDALKSGGTGKQWVRHSVHAEAFDLNGLHILDVGCGLAMFYRFLRRRGVVPASYTGIDIVEPFLEANRKAFPEARFLAMDIFEDSLADLRPDVAFMSQVFNNKYDTADNETVARAAIAQNACSAGPGSSCACFGAGPNAASSLNKTICTQGKRCMRTSSRLPIAVMFSVVRGLKLKLLAEERFLLRCVPAGQGHFHVPSGGV